MSKVREKIKLTSYDELLKVEITDGLKEIDVDKLHDFSNHPFKVSDDEKMEELTESIREKVTISRKKLKQYFPENYTKAEMENIIYQLLEKWKSDGYDI